MTTFAQSYSSISLDTGSRLASNQTLLIFNSTIFIHNAVLLARYDSFEGTVIPAKLPQLTTQHRTKKREPESRNPKHRLNHWIPGRALLRINLFQYLVQWVFIHNVILLARYDSFEGTVIPGKLTR